MGTSHKLDTEGANTADEELRLRAIIDAAPGLIAYVDTKGHYLINNRQYEVWFGRRCEEFTGRLVWDVLGDAIWSQIQPRMERAWAGERVQFEEMLPYKDGGSRWVRVTYVPDFGDDGVVRGLIVIANDITERRHTDEALHRQGQMLSIAQDAISIWRAPGGIDFWNRGAADLYGYTPDEALGRAPRELLRSHPPEPWGEIEARLVRDRRYEGIFTHYTKDGREVIVSSRMQVVPNGATMVILESSRDVTDQKQTEKALRDAEERFRLFMDNSTAVAWMKDAQGRYAYVNAAFQRRFGGPEKRWIGHDDFAVWPAQVARQFTEHDAVVVQRGRPTEITEQSVTADGAIRTWLVSKFPLCDSAGRRFVGGIAIDTTVQEAAEAALRKEHAFNTILLRTLSTVIVVLDSRGKIIHVNHAFESLTGYDAAEIEGKKFFDLFIVPEEQSRTAAAFAALCRGELSSRSVNRIRTREGALRLVEWNSSVLFGDQSEVELVIGTGVDITERRELEREVLEIGDRERQRIGQDLHDGLGQELTAQDFFNHIFLTKLRVQAPHLAPEFEQIANQLRETIKHARLLSHGLLPVAPNPEGLMLALQNLAETTSHASIECCFQCDKPVLLHGPDLATHLYRIAQEGVANALKHAGANRIQIILKQAPPVWELAVVDNGVGFASDAVAENGMGLRIMQYRAELIGARLSIVSIPSEGVRITCTLPCHENSQKI